MSDSQRFPVAAHALAFLAHSKAFAPERAVSSAARRAGHGAQARGGRRGAALEGGARG